MMVQDQYSGYVHEVPDQLAGYGLGEVVYDGFGSTGGSQAIVDHCSVSWGVDEVFSINKTENLSVQWCMVTESLYHSLHQKGNHQGRLCKNGTVPTVNRHDWYGIKTKPGRNKNRGQRGQGRPGKGSRRE